MPVASIDKNDARYPLFKFALEASQLMMGEDRKSAGFAGGVLGMFVMSCVFVGHAEGKPMNATKIAHYLNAPRTTVLRKLKELLDAGVLVQRGTYYFLAPGSEKPRASVAKVTALAKRLFANL